MLSVCTHLGFHSSGGPIPKISRLLAKIELLDLPRSSSNISEDLFSHSTFSSPFTRPTKPTPLNSRNSTSLLPPPTHSTPFLPVLLASPFTRPPKPTPLNSTSLLQMFRKISSAAAHSFSSLASPFTRPPKPSPLNSRNSTSLFTYAESSHDKPKIGLSTARLRKFLQTNCKSGDVSADEAFRFFHRMVQMEPRCPLYSFNLLLKGLAKNERYYDVLSLFGKMNSAGLTPNFFTLNILLNCSCTANRVCDAFLVMGRILRNGYSPTIVTFTCLIKGLCNGSRIYDAVQLYLRLKKFGCCPNEITWRTLYRRLVIRRLEIISIVFKLYEEEKVIGNDQYCVRCKPDVVSYSCIIGEEGKEDNAVELLFEMHGRGFSPNVRVYNSLMNGLCYAAKLEEAFSLLRKMVDREIQCDGETLYVVIDMLGQAGYMEGFKWLLDRLIECGLDLRTLKAGEIEEANRVLLEMNALKLRI